MPNLSLSRLKERYPGAATSDNYRAIMTEIIADNHERIQRAVGRLQVSHFKQAAARIKRSSTNQIALPSLDEVLPKRSVFLRKGAEQGRMISDDLRKKLTADLRASVADYLKGGAESMQWKQGERRGRIKPELVNVLQERLTATFDGYTKPDATGVPKNIRTIAETESRSAISDIKHTWNQRLAEQNQGRIQIVKIWRHHPGLSKEPRWWHKELDGVEKPLDSFFTVKDWNYRKANGWYWETISYMQHTHDPTAWAGNVIGCHCEVDYVTRII